MKISKRGGIDDTDPKAQAVQIEIYRRMTPAQKMAVVESANAWTQQVALAGLRVRYPEAAPEELRRRLLGLLLGEELATKVYGPLP